MGERKRDDLRTVRRLCKALGSTRPHARSRYGTGPHRPSAAGASWLRIWEGSLTANGFPVAEELPDVGGVRSDCDAFRPRTVRPRLAQRRSHIAGNAVRMAPAGKAARKQPHRTHRPVDPPRNRPRHRNLVAAGRSSVSDMFGRGCLGGAQGAATDISRLRDLIRIRNLLDRKMFNFNLTYIS